ncbi:MAG: flippase [Flavobacteriaceae bacterium]|nr:flippase [Flavobacteriaceae bacterium]
MATNKKDINKKKSTRELAVKGIIWSTFERFGQQGIHFAITIVLARILLPEHFGLVGMLAFFLALARSILDSGFGQALIQKKDPTNLDFSTIFYFNLLIAVVLYIILFFCAPLIARFFNEPQLIRMTRVLSLNVIFNSIGLIHHTYFVKKLQFSKLAGVTFFSVIISGTVGIVAAVRGLGVWALVIQSNAFSISKTILLWIFNKWYPGTKISMNSLRELFPFGSRLLVAGIIERAFENIYKVVIGKYYSSAELGYFSNARRVEQLLTLNITRTIQRVTFPLFSGFQDNEKRLKEGYKKSIQMLAFLNIPVMVILVVFADPLIRLLLTEKWLAAVPMLQLLCLVGTIYPFQALNLNIVKVKGRSDLFLRLKILQKIITVLAIVVAIGFDLGIIGLIYGMMFQNVVALVLNSLYSGKMIGYPLKSQLIDIIRYFIMGAIAGLTGYGVLLLVDSAVLRTVIGLPAFSMAYLVSGKQLRVKAFQYVKSARKTLGTQEKNEAEV